MVEKQNILKHNLIYNNIEMQNELVKNKLFKKENIIYKYNNMSIRQNEIQKLEQEFKALYPKKRLIHNGKYTTAFKDFNKEQLVFEKQML